MLLDPEASTLEVLCRIRERCVAVRFGKELGHREWVRLLGLQSQSLTKVIGFGLIAEEGEVFLLLTSVFIPPRVHFYLRLLCTLEGVGAKLNV